MKSGCSLCLALGLAWVAGVAVLAYVNWPHIPLDMSPLDPATVAAWRAELLRYLLVCAAAALGPPLAASLLVRLVKATRR